MTVSVTVEVAYEHWGGYDDPRLPTRVWKMAGLVLGDATGGQRNLVMEYVNSGAPLIAQSFSLEELYVIDTDNVTKNMSITSTNLGSFGTLARQLGLSAVILSTGGTQAGLDIRYAQALRGTFLGGMRVEGASSSLTLQVANVDGAVLQVWAGGYVWGQRSQSAMRGGFQRPPNGIFKA